MRHGEHDGTAHGPGPSRATQAHAGALQVMAEAPLPGGDQETVWSILAAQSTYRRNQTAILDGVVEVGYEQLLNRAQSIAGELIARGVAPGSLVGVCAGRTWEVVATLVGVIRAGCGYVPLDPAYPVERVRYMVDHSRLALAVVDSDETAELCSEAPEVVRLDLIPDRLATPGAEPRACDIAYVIYTSGSTGDPKGVSVEHRNVVAMVKAMHQLLDDEDLAGVLAGASLCFDPSVMEILGTLMLGGTVVLAENVLALRDLPGAHRVRTTIMVPSAMKALLASGPLPTGVRTVVLGGEVLTHSLITELHEAPVPPRVINVYGPTEATVFTTSAITSMQNSAITLGRPTSTSRAYILDERLQPVSAVGVAGELFLAGEQLARGYLHDDELTRQRFLEVDPNGPVPARRIYRTGDLCRWTTTGELEFIGRVDRQVKIRGHRIELDEIETVIGSMPGVDETAVVVEPANGKSLLVAFVTTRHGSATVAGIRTELATRLPRYMIPHAVVPLSKMPRLPNGKVDHQQLPSVRTRGGVIGSTVSGDRPVGPGTGSSSTAPAVQAPGYQRSELLAAVQREAALLLGSPEAASVPSDKPLEALGLDSLDIAELTIRLSQALTTSLPTSTLVASMTVVEAAEAIMAVSGQISDRQDAVGHPNVNGSAARLDAFQAQVRSGHPPAFAAKVRAWSASDKGVLVQRMRNLLTRSGLDPYGKVVRTGSAERGVVADARTGEEREALIWTTNLYLGFNRDEEIIEEARKALSRFGTGMGISAAGSGQTDLHLEFEREFAAMVGKPSACLFPTGFTASLGAIAGTVGEQDVVVMDQLCHASLVDGARLSGARIRTFRHNSAADLRSVLKAETSPYHTTLVVLESVYSMGEGAAPLLDIVATAKEFGALVLVDEAHSFGLYGAGGTGLCAAEGATAQVDFLLTTLSKALGSIGGVVAAQEHHIELLKTSARAYVFQANISPADIAAALAALRRVGEGEALRERLWDTARYMRTRFSDAGYELGPGDGLIITPFFSDEERLRMIARGLFERGVHTAAVTYPIVERGLGRLRFICSASHTRDDVDKTLRALMDADASASRRPMVHEDGRPASRPSSYDPSQSVAEWASAFNSYMSSRADESSTPSSSGMVTITPPEEGEVVTVQVSVRSATRTADLAAATATCSLQLLDDEAVSALCSQDVERLLESVVSGACMLGGYTQPFVWLVARMSDWQLSRTDEA